MRTIFPPPPPPPPPPPSTQPPTPPKPKPKTPTKPTTTQTQQHKQNPPTPPACSGLYFIAHFLFVLAACCGSILRENSTNVPRPEVGAEMGEKMEKSKLLALRQN